MASDRVKHDCVDPALSVLDNRWTVLVLREAFHGARRFGQFAQALDIARTVLAARLDALVGDGVLERHLYDEERNWYEYRLTQKGLDLLPAIVALSQWSQKYSDGEPAMALRHRDCGVIAPLQPRCSACDKPLNPSDVEPFLAAPGRRQRPAGQR